MTLDQILERLGGARKTAGGYMARCPAHEDRLASLSLKAGEGGAVLLKCHAGCDLAAILARLGLEKRDLFPEREREEPQATFDYRDAKGTLLYQVVRFPGKQFRQRRPEGSGWSWKLAGVPRVPYRLRELFDADPEETVYVAEGEKDVESLRSRGLVATCNAGGAGKWDRAWADFFRGRDVVVLPDNDQPGRDHAADVARSLSGVALRVRVVELPGLPEKGDVSDWLATGGSAELLAKLVASAGEWTGRTTAVPSFAASPSRLAGEVEQRKEGGRNRVPFGVPYVDDFCRGILPTDLVMVGAVTGAGKTAFAAVVAQEAARMGKRVYFFALEAEDREIERRAKYRYLSRKLHALSVPGVRRLNYLDWYLGDCEDICAPYNREADAEVARELATLYTFYRESEGFGNEDLERMLREIRDEADLIVLDHLHYIDEDEGTSENASIKRTVKILRDNALRRRRPVVLVAHLRKKNAQRPRIVPEMDDFHGDSNAGKIVTRGVVIAPAYDQKPERSWFAPTYLSVVKDRPGGVQGYVALASFNLTTFSYGPDYRLGRLTSRGEAWNELAANEVPRWAKRAFNRNRQEELG